MIEKDRKIISLDEAVADANEKSRNRLVDESYVEEVIQKVELVKSGSGRNPNASHLELSRRRSGKALIRSWISLTGWKTAMILRERYRPSVPDSSCSGF